MDRHTLTVTQLNQYIYQIFQAEELLHNILVVGEISGFSVKSGHAYFTLKDNDNAIQCTCFGVAKTYIPKNGEQVILTGSVGYYGKAGRLSFNATKIEPQGRGAIMLRLEALKQKLEAEGIFDVSHKKQISAFVNNICVVTSKSGAVIKDIVRTLRNKNSKINISLIDTKVQGETAASDMISALNLADSLNFDVIILARGGGSFEDLLPFYDENLLRTIYSLKTPIVSAVGHETDFTFCDFVADKRAATPTAAAELFYNFSDYVKCLKDIMNRAYFAVKSKLNENFRRYRYITDNLTLKAEKRILDGFADINILKQKLFHNIDAKVSESERRLEQVIAKINTLNPAAMLTKGFHKIEKDGKLLNCLKDVKKGDELNILSTDGEIKAEVKEIIFTEKIKETRI